MKSVRHFILILATVLLSVNVSAQEAAKGSVRDAGGPLAGVMIQNKDNGSWATTDLDGNFTIQKLEKGQTLEISMLGYKTLTIVYNGQSLGNLTMTEDRLELEETVVIGYGSV